MTRSNAITVAPSTETGLATNLLGLESSIYAAAKRNLDTALEEQDGNMPTTLERTAIIEVEALKLVGGLDLAAILLRGKILAKIRTQNLLNIHPGHYDTQAQMAVDQGISAAELSYIQTLYDIVFPWLEENGMSVATIWHEIGKSKFFELTPIMSAVISGEMPGRGTTLDAVMALTADATTALTVDGVAPTEDDVRSRVMNRLIEIGSTLPVMEVRRAVRPTHTPDINATIVHQGEQFYLVAQMTEDQRVMFRRLSGTHVDFVEVNGDTIPNEVGVLRRMIGG
jgi:hypothetical protein